MHIEKIILSALIFGVSLPLMAEECPADSPLKGKDGVCYSCDEKDNVYLEYVFQAKTFSDFILIVFINSDKKNSTTLNNKQNGENIFNN